jgi:hypothetical protein
LYTDVAGKLERGMRFGWGRTRKHFRTGLPVELDAPLKFSGDVGVQIFGCHDLLERDHSILIPI